MQSQQPRSVLDLVGMALQPIEQKLLTDLDSMPATQKLALERASQHLYEAIFWIQAAGRTAGGIITP